MKYPSLAKPPAFVQENNKKIFGKLSEIKLRAFVATENY
jgi:hypothetical protein